MKKKSTLFTFAILTVFFFNSFAQTSYYTGFDNTAEKAGWFEYRKGDLGTYRWGVTTSQVFSSPNCISHNYPVGGSQVTDNWFVSPSFDFSSGGTIDSVRFAFSGFGLPATADTVAIYLLSGSANPSSATSKLMLVDFRSSKYNNDNTWRIETNVAIPSTAGTCYIAFRYKTINNWLDVRFDNLAISSSSVTAINFSSISSNDIQLFPQPIVNTVTVKVNNDQLKNQSLSLEIFNVFGKVVLRKVINGTEKLTLDEPNGAYFYQLSNAQKQVLTTGKLFIQH